MLPRFVNCMFRFRNLRQGVRVMEEPCERGGSAGLLT